MAERWHLNGKVLVACNCDWGCPCNFNARPTTGKCEGGWTWHVEEGSFGDVKLDGLSFSVYVNWPGAIHEGNGEALVLIDEHADASQRSAIEVLLGGKAGGPWAVLGWTWPKVHGPYAVVYDLAFDGVKTRLKCGEYVNVGVVRSDSGTPGDRAGSYLGVILPGIVLKRGDLGARPGSGSLCGIEYDHFGSVWRSAHSVRVAVSDLLVSPDHLARAGRQSSSSLDRSAACRVFAEGHIPTAVHSISLRPQHRRHGSCALKAFFWTIEHLLHRRGVPQPTCRWWSRRTSGIRAARSFWFLEFFGHPNAAARRRIRRVDVGVCTDEDAQTEGDDGRHA